MIPHTPPMRFEVETDGAVVLPGDHPLIEAGVYPSAALVELAAQLAGRLVDAPPGHGGLLVDVAACTLFVTQVPPGTRVLAVVQIERGTGPLQRFHVALPGILEARLTLLVR